MEAIGRLGQAKMAPCFGRSGGLCGVPTIKRPLKLGVHGQIVIFTDSDIYIYIYI